MALALIVDGHSVICRAVYAVTRKRPELVFLSMFQALLARYRPDYVVVALDGPKEELARREIYSEYKATRKPADPGIKEAIARCIGLLQAAQVPTLRVPGWEADDIVATLAVLCAGDSCEVVIASTDKDLGQCANNRVRLWDGKQELGPQDVEDRWGVAPSKVPHVQALCGDPADNIPGVAGCGPKTAAKYIQRFGSIPALYRSLGSLSAKKREALQGFAWKRSLALARLRNDLPIQLKAADLIWQGLHQEKIERYLAGHRW